MMPVVVCLAAGTTAQAGDLLFAEDDPFDITIRAPLARLMKTDAGVSDASGSLDLPDGTSIPMTVNKYGISRLRECQLASLVITIDENAARDTVFEDRKTLRMVTPCRLRGEYDKFIMLEYLVYRSYQVVAEPALHARLVRVLFQDSEKSAKGETGYAFFIEDIGQAADRGGLVWLGRQSQGTRTFDAAQLTLMTLFQYMVGNTDWSAVKGRDVDRCCHNIAVLGQDGANLKTALPFDFDQSGLVNPPYAVPGLELGIRRVTDRLYRGLCEHNGELPDAIAVFNEKRPEIEALFGRDDLPYPKDRQQGLKYLQGFYDTINDPKKLEKKILNACR